MLSRQFVNAPFSNFRYKLVHLEDFLALLIFVIALFFIFHFHTRNMALPSGFFGFFLLLSGNICVKSFNRINTSQKIFWSFLFCDSFHFHFRNMALPSAVFGFLLLLSGSVCVHSFNLIDSLTIKALMRGRHQQQMREGRR